VTLTVRRGALPSSDAALAPERIAGSGYGETRMAQLER
jgi:hypothetical protein